MTRTVINISMAFCCFAASIALADAPIPEQWTLGYTIRDVPTRTEYFGQSVPSSIRTANRYTFVTWWKIVFDQPQKTKKFRYQTVIYSLSINCTDHTFAVLRDIKMSSAGKVLVDTSVPEDQAKFRAPLPLPPDGHTGKLPGADGVARLDLSDGCDKGD